METAKDEPAVLLLGGVKALLEELNVEGHPPPNNTAPKGAHFLGPATSNQRALFVLRDSTAYVHDAMHRVRGLPYGRNHHLDLAHRQLHLAMSFAGDLLAEDISNMYVEIDEARAYGIDRNWMVYCTYTRATRLKMWWNRLWRRRT